MSRPVYWLSPAEKCDLCSAPLMRVMFDCATPAGPWGLLCQVCFVQHPVDLGPGRGQRYEQQEDGRWLKTAG